MHAPSVSQRARGSRGAPRQGGVDREASDAHPRRARRHRDGRASNGRGRDGGRELPFQAGRPGTPRSSRSGRHRAAAVRGAKPGRAPAGERLACRHRTDGRGRSARGRRSLGQLSLPSGRRGARGLRCPAREWAATRRPVRGRSRAARDVPLRGGGEAAARVERPQPARRPAVVENLWGGGKHHLREQRPLRPRRGPAHAPALPRRARPNGVPGDAAAFSRVRA